MCRWILGSLPCVSTPADHNRIEDDNGPHGDLAIACRRSGQSECQIHKALI